MATKQSYEFHINRLLSDISAYILFLSGEKGLNVSIHQMDAFVNSFNQNLITWNYHTNPYCLCLKRNADIQKECQRRQICMFESISDEPFFGTCWAGMGEFVFPVSNPHDNRRAFISVSGFAGDPEKTRAQMRKIVQTYDMPLAEMEKFQADLKQEHPPLEELSPLLQPLAHMLTLLLMYLDDMGATFPEKDSSSRRLFNSICQNIRRNYDTNYSLEEIAEANNCSVSHISHLFRKYAQCSYRNYVNTMKTELAKVYLLSTSMSMQEISDHLGFSNSNYFSTVFRRMCGMSPREYRQALKKHPGTEKSGKS